MTTTLGLYNAALLLFQPRTLSTISDDDPARYALDTVYAGALAYVLEQGQWAFASKASSLTGSVASAFGYAYTYTKPSDWVRQISLSASQTYYPPYETYVEAGSNLYAADSTLYTQYVSNGASYGGDLTKWTASYTKVVEAYLALQVYRPLSTGGEEQEKRLTRIYEERLAFAKAKDTINRTMRVLSSAHLEIYTGALRLLGRRLLNSASDELIERRMMRVALRSQQDGEEDPKRTYGRELEDETVARRLIDEFWDSAVQTMLEMGFWNFAQRTVQIDASTSVAPAFGFAYAIEVPSDYVRTVALSTNENLWPVMGPLEYENEKGSGADYINCNFTPVYLQYISNDTSYGLDMSSWPSTFKNALQAYIALEIAPQLRIPASRIAQLEANWKDMLSNAVSKDAANQAPEMPAPGQFVRARRGSSWRWGCR